MKKSSILGIGQDPGCPKAIPRKKRILRLQINKIFLRLNQDFFLVSQADVNQIMYTSLAKREMLLKSQIEKKKIEIIKFQKLLKKKQRKSSNL